MPDPTSDTLDRIHDRISQAAPSGVWSRADFLDIGTPNAVEKALQRLTLRGDIRRPYRGLYDKPSVSKLTGKMVFPPRASFIDAIARRDKLRVLVDGMTAANDLGLTTADFKRISAKTAFWAGRPAMRVIQALTWFRDERPTLDATVNGIVRHLSRDPNCEKVTEDLRENIHAVPAWMYPLIETIMRRLGEDQSERSVPGTKRAKGDHAEDVH